MISFRFFVGIQVWAQLIPEPWEDYRAIVSIKLTDTIVTWKTTKTLQLERAIEQKQSESQLCRCCGSKFPLL